VNWYWRGSWCLFLCNVVFGLWFMNAFVKCWYSWIVVLRIFVRSLGFLWTHLILVLNEHSIILEHQQWKSLVTKGRAPKNLFEILCSILNEMFFLISCSKSTENTILMSYNMPSNLKYWDHNKYDSKRVRWQSMQSANEQLFKLI